jgi:thiol-disulfide isomerase/thioredoxin
MAVTPSTMLPLGTLAPDFKLPDTNKNAEIISLQQAKSDIATVIMFICNHCPYVKHIQTKLVAIANEYQKKNIKFIAINSNDVQKYPADSPEQMHLEAINHHYPFPYLYDESQQVAKDYQAACTPDFYIFDHQLACVYRGRFDASTPGNNIPVTGEDLTLALEQILSKQPITVNQLPSVGCNIKWKKA